LDVGNQLEKENSSDEDENEGKMKTDDINFESLKPDDIYQLCKVHKLIFDKLSIFLASQSKKLPTITPSDHMQTFQISYELAGNLLKALLHETDYKIDLVQLREQPQTSIVIPSARSKRWRTMRRLKRLNRTSKSKVEVVIPPETDSIHTKLIENFYYNEETISLNLFIRLTLWILA